MACGKGEFHLSLTTLATTPPRRPPSLPLLCMLCNALMGIKTKLGDPCHTLPEVHLAVFPSINIHL